MWLRTALPSCFVLPIALASIAAEGSDREDKSGQRTYVLEIDALMVDELHQHMLVKEDNSFYVSTRVGKERWTFSGDVNRAVEGHLPVLLKHRWFESAESHQNGVVPKLVKINDKVKRFSGAIHGPMISVTARVVTEADQLPTSTDMQQALHRMIKDLKKAKCPHAPPNTGQPQGSASRNQPAADE